MKRALLPSLNPTGLGSAIAAIYAAVVMIANAANHHGVINPQVIVAALAAAAFLFTRGKVTPTADPRDGNGQPLTAPAATRPAASAADIAAALPPQPGPIPFGDLTVSTVAPASPPPSVPDLLAPPVAPLPAEPPAPVLPPVPPA